MRMHLWWSLCTVYFLTCQVTVTKGDSLCTVYFLTCQVTVTKGDSLCTVYFLTCQVTVTKGDANLCWCVPWLYFGRLSSDVNSFCLLKKKCLVFSTLNGLIFLIFPMGKICLLSLGKANSHRVASPGWLI